MKLFGKKAMSLFLAFVMAFSMCSVAAFAEESYTLTLDKTELNLTENNKSATLTVELPVLEDGSEPDVQWSVEPQNGVVTGSESGPRNSKYEITAVANGTATITAWLEGHEEIAVSCQVTVTSEKPFSVELAEGEENTLEVPYGTQREEVIEKLKAIDYVFSYGSEGDPTTETKHITAWSGSEYSATTLGEYVFTGTVEGAWNQKIQQEVTVEVVPAVVTEQERLEEIRIPLGLTAEQIGTRLEAIIKEVKLKTNDGKTITLDSTDNSRFGAWQYNAAANEGREFSSNYEKGARFVFVKAFQPEFDSITGLDAVRVTVVARNEDVGTVYARVAYDEDGSSIRNLNTLIAEHIEAYLENYRVSGNTDYDVTLSVPTTGMYGSVQKRTSRDEYSYVLDNLSNATLDALKSAGQLNEQKIQFSATGKTDSQTYEGVLQIVILDSFDITAEWEDANFSFNSKVVSKIRENLKKLYGNSSVLDYVQFDDIYTEGGVLYESSSSDEEVSNDRKYYYGASSSRADLTKLYYVPVGNGMPFVAEYVAYSTVADQYITGTLVIESPEMLCLKVDINHDDIYQLSYRDLQDILTELDEDYTLDYITFENVSTSYGTLYYLYNANNKTNTKASASKKYYVEPSKSADYAIDDLTFVPKENTKTGIAVINFDARVYYGRNGQYAKTIPGVLTINIQQAADITYKTGANTAITFSAEDFVNFLKKNVSGTNLQLTSVEFDGLPAYTTLGYMYDGSVTSYNRNYISKPDNQTYYYKPSSNSRMDLDNLTWLAGSKVGTQRVEFTIHYTKGNSTRQYDKTGILDLVTENTVTIKQTIKASEWYQNFRSDMMKDSRVSYVEFTSVTGGKLMYNFCKSNQEAVKTGTYYYVSGTGTQKQLSYVSFVPAYGATTGKVTMKIYGGTNLSSIVEYQFTITAVNGSAYFNDITAYSYGNYAKSIDLLFSLGIVQGNSTTSRQYNPTGTLTRGEWITMLYRAAGSPAVYGTNSFTDVPAWCKDAVQWAVTNGITTGTSATTFEHSMQLDRRQIALFLYRWAQKLGLDTTGTVNLNLYADGSTVPSWASAAMQWALKNGYLDTVNGMVKPLDYTTRAVIADSLHRVLVK